MGKQGLDPVKPAERVQWLLELLQGQPGHNVTEGDQTWHVLDYTGSLVKLVVQKLPRGVKLTESQIQWANDRLQQEDLRHSERLPGQAPGVYEHRILIDLAEELAAETGGDAELAEPIESTDLSNMSPAAVIKRLVDELDKYKQFVLELERQLQEYRGENTELKDQLAAANRQQEEIATALLGARQALS